MSGEDLETFLSQFYLIKTPQGFILGRSSNPNPEIFPGLDANFFAYHQQLHPNIYSNLMAQGAERGEGLKGSREELTKRESNFQLRVRRADPSKSQR